MGLVCTLLATPPPPLPFVECARWGELLRIRVPEHLLLRVPLTPPRVAVNLHCASNLGPQGLRWLDSAQGRSKRLSPSTFTSSPVREAAHASSRRSGDFSEANFQEGCSVDGGQGLQGRQREPRRSSAAAVGPRPTLRRRRCGARWLTLLRCSRCVPCSPRVPLHALACASSSTRFACWISPAEADSTLGTEICTGMHGSMRSEKRSCWYSSRTPMSNVTSHTSSSCDRAATLYASAADGCKRGLCSL